MKKDLISINDLSKQEIITLLKLTRQLKTKLTSKARFTPLAGKTLALIFQKPSTRTRVSFQVGMHQLGGVAIFLSGQDLQLKRGETLADTAKTLSRYINGIVIRANKHQDIIELAEYSTVSVINGLSDMEHPCQALCDIYTILEKYKFKTSKFEEKIRQLNNIKITYIGDGNNVANSLLYVASILGMKLSISTPKGYEPNGTIFNKSKQIASNTGAVIELNSDPEQAVKNADFIYTDVWTSMGQENEENTRKQLFQPYQVNKKLVDKANPNVLIMHCLPAHRGEEITTDILESDKSIVFDQAENRLHMQKSILTHLLK